MNFIKVSVVLVVVSALLPMAFSQLCEIRFAESLQWRRHPDDCSSAYMCLLGRIVSYSCPEGFVIGSDDVTCVLEGSDLDDCSALEMVDVSDVEIKELKLSEKCKKSERTADEKNCARYSECITLPDGNTTLVPQECQYPDLFNAKTGKCESFKDVQCAEGQEIPKSPCDYLVEQCTSAHCVPCNVRHPSCTGLQDGANPWVGREWSPYYVICEEERVTLQTQCKSDKNQQIFHPDQRSCVEYDVQKIVG